MIAVLRPDSEALGAQRRSICSYLEATIGIVKLGTVKYCNDLGRQMNRLILQVLC